MKYKIFLGLTFLILLSGLVYSAPIDSLTHYMPFDLNASDIIGGKQASTEGAPLLSSTYKLGGGSYYYDGSDDLHTYDFDVADAGVYTVSFWFMDNGTTGGAKRAVSNTNGGSATSFVYYLTTTHNMYLCEVNLDTGAGFPTGVWQHVVLTADGVKFRVFLNGTQAGGDGATTGSCNPASNFRVGGRDATFNGAKGFIDEVAVYSVNKSLADISALYNGGAGFAYPFGVTPPEINFTFVSQVPTDIDATNMIDKLLNITYNVTAVALNTTTPFLNYSIINGAFYTNGVEEKGYSRKMYSLNSTNQTYLFQLNDNRLYPATYNLNETLMENSLHSLQTLTSQNDYLKVQLLNVSNTRGYNYFEVYANTTGNSEIFYCNSSYTTGNIQTSNLCTQFATLSSTTFNHTHNQSKHQAFSFPINVTTGKINNVYVTPLSYFVVRGNNQGVTVGYVSSYVRNNTALSTNSGTTFTNQTYTTDLHIHQFYGNETLSYTACAYNTTGALFCDTLRSDTLTPTSLPPTSPVIDLPIENQNITRFLFVNWTASTPSVNRIISNYTVYLLNSDLTLNRTLGVNTTATSINVDTYSLNLSIGSYYVKVTAFDNASTTSFDISDVINLTTNSLLNITAIDGYTYANISNFTVILLDLTTGNIFNVSTGTSNLSAYANVVRGRTYNLTFDQALYALHYANKTIENYPQNNYTFTAYKTNSVYITISDESTGALITNASTGVDTNITFTGSVGSVIYNTSTGILFVSNITADTYVVTFNAPLYAQRQYILTVTNRSTQTLNAYLTQSSTSVLFSYTDRETGVVLENVNVGISKIINGTWTLVETKLTDVTGRTQFTVSTNTNYRFTSSKTDYDTKIFNLNPVIFTSYTVQMSKSGAPVTQMDFGSIAVSYSPTTFNKVSNTFTWTITAPNGSLTNYGFTLNTQCKHIGNFTGVNAFGETEVKTFNLSCASNYDTITLYFYYKNTEEIQRNFTYIFGLADTTTSGVFTNTLNGSTYGMGLFERVLITVVLTLILMGVVGSIGGVVPSLVVGLVIMGYLTSVGFIPFTVIIITLFVGALFIMSTSNR